MQKGRSSSISSISQWYLKVTFQKIQFAEYRGTVKTISNVHNVGHWIVVWFSDYIKTEGRHCELGCLRQNFRVHRETVLLHPLWCEVAFCVATEKVNDCLEKILLMSAVHQVRFGCRYTQ